MPGRKLDRVSEITVHDASGNTEVYVYKKNDWVKRDSTENGEKEKSQT